MKLQNLKPILPELIFNQLEDIITKYNINTEYRMSHFLGQCSHESGNFKVFEENLRYKPERLLVVFPKYFKNKILANYNTPEKIANLVYANRMGNGDEASGDGYKFRGRGCIQITGKSNYQAFGCLDNPDLLKNEKALTSAAWFFNKNNLNKISDEGINDSTIAHVTKIVNGGNNGLSERIELTKKYYNLLK